MKKGTTEIIERWTRLAVEAKELARHHSHRPGKHVDGAGGSNGQFG